MGMLLQMSEKALHWILIKVADKSEGPNQSLSIRSPRNLTATIAISWLSKNTIRNTEVIKFHMLALSRGLCWGGKSYFLSLKNTIESYFKEKRWGEGGKRRRGGKRKEKKLFLQPIDKLEQFVLISV